MSEDRHARVKELFAAARARPQEDRDAFLAEACGLDTELRREVRSLLAYDDETTGLRTRDSADRLTAVERFAPGTVLAGRYHVAGRLGRGGMGELYRAEDAWLGVPVALKFLPAELTEDVERLSLLLNEVRLARAVTHPNVCRIHDVGEQGGVHFISMELVAGEDLAQRLRRVGRLTREEALDVARGLCAGLDAAHAQGILHRDLKPANLLIDEGGELHIADFGLSLDIGDSPRRCWPRAGTPAYMAPEQHAGREVSVRTDLYAMGLVLYEVFTGRPAFSAGSRKELAQLHREEVPAPPAEIVADLDPAIEKVILRCLEKDPRRRPSSAQAVAAALPGRLDLTEGTQLRTLVMSDVADRTRLVESLGDSGAAELFERHDLLFGDLVREHGGREVGVPATPERGGRLLLFERPIHAVLFAQAYHSALTELAAQEAAVTPEARLAVHLGEVVLRSEAAAGSLRVEGLAPLLVARLMALAGARQTLLTRGAFDVARRGALDEAERAGQLSWLAHGRYLVEGIVEAFEVFEVGEPGKAPLLAPEGSQEARRIYEEDVLTGWRPAAGRPLPGRGHWTIDRKLGEGGFGEVWLAVHRKTRERRVLKFCYETSRLRGLQREITLFRLLKEELGERDDIGRILDWNFDEPPYFIESEYTAGGNLEEWAVARGGIGQVPLAERLEIVAQVAEALSAAHSVGVLHKDVKPSNVLMWRDAGGRARARLSDFGIGAVTERERLAEAGITVLGMTETNRGDSSSDTGGTRLYMAPELIEGRAATVQADIYALGVMLYQVVVGDLKRALAPGWRRDVADELLCEDVAAAVDGDPGRRLSSAADLGRRLRTLDERRAECEAGRRLQANLERLHRRRRLAVAVAAVLAVFAVTVGVLALRIRHEAKRAEEQAARTRDLALATTASKLLVSRQETWGNLVALEVRRPDAMPVAIEALHEALNVPVEEALLRHDNNVVGADWSGDGRRILTVSMNGTARIWNDPTRGAADTSEEIVRLNGHTDFVTARWSRNDRRVLTASMDGTSRIWDAETGQEIVRLDDRSEPVGCAAWSHGGNRVVTNTGGEARIWNAETGEEIHLLGDDKSQNFRWDTENCQTAFSHDDRRVLTTFQERARIWDVATGAEIARMEHDDQIRSASFRGDGSRVLTASSDKTLRIWDAETGAEITRIDGHTGALWGAWWSQDGHRLLSGSDDETARIWNGETGAEIFRLGHEAPVLAAEWSGDDRRVITLSYLATMRLWDADTGVEILSFRFTDWANHPRFSDDGKRILIATYDQTVRILNIETGAEILRLEGERSSWSGDGRRILTASKDGMARIWNVVPGRAGTGAAPGRAEILQLSGHTARVRSLSWSDDGRRVFTSSEDGTARTWNAAPGRAETRAEITRLHTGRVSTVFGEASVVWSGDGRRVLTASDVGPARIWDAAPDRAQTDRAQPGAEILRFGDNIISVSWSGDGRRVLTGSMVGGTARIWNAETGAEIVRLSGHSGYVIAGPWSDDGHRVLTSSKDHTARIWNTETGAEIVRMVGHTREVYSSRWSGDGRRVVTASKDLTVRIWDAETGAEAARLLGHTWMVGPVRWSGDDRHILTGAGDQTARVWNAETGAEIFRMGHDGAVLSAAWSPDGQRVLTSDEGGTTRIWVVPDEPTDYLRGRIRARTRLCLPTDFRQERLLESHENAARHTTACERCVPVFFERLGSAPKSDWEIYVAAWQVYEACLGRDG